MRDWSRDQRSEKSQFGALFSVSWQISTGPLVPLECNSVLQSLLHLFIIRQEDMKHEHKHETQDRFYLI